MSVADVDGLRSVARQLAAASRPGEQVEAYVARGTTTAVQVFGGRVESLTTAASAGAGIRVVVGHRQGFASCGTLDAGVLDETLAEARDNARFATEDPFVGLAEPDGVEPVPQQLWDDRLDAVTTVTKVERALELERAVTGRDARVTRVRSATYADAAGAAAVVTSTGIEAVGRSTWASLSASALADDGGEVQTGYGYDVGRTLEALSVERVATDAVERATRLLGARPTPSRPLTIVLEPRLAAVILGITAGALSGERVVKGRSPFADRVGEPIASSALHLVDDPTDPRSFGADSHDGEGLACRRNVLLDDGVLRGFLFDSVTARRAGTASTASAVRSFRSTPSVGHQALAVTPGARSLEELVSSVDDGLLVQSLTGLHSGVNAVSGDISVGAEGLLIRSGVVGAPVREVTLASTLQRLLLEVREVGADLEWLPGGTGAATLVVDGVMLSGT